MRSGRLHRYNTAPNEVSEVALLEQKFAEYFGAKYCAAICSCGSSMYVALRSAGVEAGDIDEAIYLGDRIVAQEGKLPGRMKAVFDIDLPRSREHADITFLQLRRTIMDATELTL